MFSLAQLLDGQNRHIKGTAAHVEHKYVRLLQRLKKSRKQKLAVVSSSSLLNCYALLIAGCWGRGNARSSFSSVEHLTIYTLL